MKKIAVISDLHCGHLVGLTPPNWQVNGEGWRKKIRDTQRQAWNWFDKTMLSLGTLDAVFCNGDAIDGQGKKSGGTEQITTDMNVQCEMASFILQRYMSKKTKLYMTYGTPYHTGEDADAEALIANDCNATEIGGQVFVDVEGVVFNLKHKVGSSGTPHGRATPVKRAQLWANLWAGADEQPRSDVLIRSHVHYHTATYDPDFGWAMTTPALQAYGSKYGSRQCEGRCHFGVTYFEIDKGEIKWKPLLAKLAVHKSQTSKL